MYRKQVGCAMGENEEEVVTVETIYKRKPKVKAVHKMKWVNDLDYIPL
jgi:hypothetical protein